jgi:hypothetical protein
MRLVPLPECDDPIRYDLDRPVASRRERQARAGVFDEAGEIGDDLRSLCRPLAASPELALALTTMTAVQGATRQTRVAGQVDGGESQE